MSLICFLTKIWQFYFLALLYVHNYTLDFDTTDFVKFTAHQKEDLLDR